MERKTSSGWSSRVKRRVRPFAEMALPHRGQHNHSRSTGQNKRKKTLHFFT